MLLYRTPALRVRFIYIKISQIHLIVNLCIQNAWVHIIHSSRGVIKMSIQQLDPIIVGKVIAKFRSKKGITQEVLSGLSDIARTHLSAIERGERRPTLETLYRICNALDVPMSKVVRDIEKEMKNKSHV